ncbi:hypothetical protein MUN81_04115 [Hymenobacter sp. 5317J-9]|uniref:hypothetical protein n=1 Tax=Hymenobacter sp. 5317J-9 TaxID=2932250 RepID=UPI001FD65478|nr:hypothetical protein [Hymenobacter sp. 5317J-9]UOQ98682.1 hypothetical protein MUN81_04115 [Hymenobacter sp. 5317J-9]
MKKLHKILCASLVGLLALAAAPARAQVKLPPWLDKNAPASQPAPQPQTQPTVIIGGNNPVIVDRVPTDDRYRDGRYRKPLPPGQAKKYGYRANPSNGGLPPGQAKKQGYYYNDGRRYDDRRYDDRDHDDHGKGKGHGHGKGKH